MEMNKLRFRRFEHNKDLLNLYYVMTNVNEQMFFHSKTVFNSNVDYEQWLLGQMKYHYHDFYILEDSDNDSKFAGFMYSYDFRLNDGHCMICVYLTPEYRNVGYGAYAGIKFIKEIFQEYPVRKIYLTIYDYNKQSLQSNLSAGFTEEGCLKEYRYYDGKYWDMHFLAITRETFNNMMKHLAN